MIEYPMPGGGAPPDLFKGFREELGNIEKKREDKEAKAFEMASMIELADQSTMFGGDYSEAQQMAQWMTEHLDDFTDSKEGMIEFQQMAQELTNFIDVSEAYKSQNFGTAQGGPKQGTFTGYSGRKAAGLNPYEKEGFIDTKSNEDYEASYLSLSQNRNLDFNEQGRPVLSQRGRVENPFMPRLEEVAFEGGFEWFEENAKGHKFPDGEKDVQAWLELKASDPRLLRKIVKSYARSNGNSENIDALMTGLENEGFRKDAFEEFKEQAMVSFNSHTGDPKLEKVETFEELEAQHIVGYDSNIDIPKADPVVIRRIETGTGKTREEVSTDSLGFDGVYALKDPISGSEYPSLGDSRVVGFNVDRNAAIWVLVDELYEEEMTNAAGETETVERSRRVFKKAPADLVRTIEMNIPTNILKKYQRDSLRKSNEERNISLNQRFEDARNRNEVSGNQPDIGPLPLEEDAGEFTFQGIPSGPKMEEGGLLSSIKNIFRR